VKVMEMTKLTKRNHYEEIKDQLQQMILEGSLKVGDKLPSTKEMSESFGVGRSTTREALSALKAMGLIDIRQGGGCTVISSAPIAEFAAITIPELDSLRMNRVTLLELLEVRQSLEVANASVAAMKRTDADLAAFSQLLTEMELAVGHDQEGERTDLLFHRTLAEATHNTIMLRLFESFSNQLEMAIREVRRVELYANQKVAERLYLEHLEIYEAISRKDAEQAAHSMKQHLQHVEAILMKYI
jgi:GntR family transcriptional repressor for pyruvate dehydrogenase complex